MSIITKDNRHRLLLNPNVLSLTAKHVIYTPDFMKRVLSAVSLGQTAASIWEEGGFALSDFKRNYFKKCAIRWNKSFINGSFVQKPRGRYIDGFVSRDEEIAYLRAENIFLKELRALGIQERIIDSGLSLGLFRKIKDSQSLDSVNWRELAQQVITSGLLDLEKS